MRAQIPLQPVRVDLACFTQRPPDGFLNQVVGVAMQGGGSAVGEVEVMPSADEGNQADD